MRETARSAAELAKMCVALQRVPCSALKAGVTGVRGMTGMMFYNDIILLSSYYRKLNCVGERFGLAAFHKTRHVGRNWIILSLQRLRKMVIVSRRFQDLFK